MKCKVKYILLFMRIASFTIQIFYIKKKIEEAVVY